MIQARLKSYFILPAVVLNLLLGLSGLILALRGENDQLAWWGAALAAVPLPMLMARVQIMQPARTAENEPLALLASAAGVFLAAWEFLFEGSSGWQPLALAATGCAVLLLYVFWYSRFGRIASGKLDVGGKLPAFELRDTDGNAANSQDLLGKPAVLVFYRGNWSVLCMAQIREIAARHQELSDMGIRVVLISPQPVQRSRELAESQAAPFRYWVDRDNRVARELDIAVSHGVPVGVRGRYDPDTVMPTVVVTNANGTILYSDQTDNHRVRPEPDMFLAILRRAGAIAR